MTLPGEAPEPPARRRAPWSFRSLVEEVSGRPIADFQEAPGHRGSAPAPGPRPSDVPIPASAIDALPTDDPEAPLDPVDRIYPPLSGAAGRAWHGEATTHHEATLRSVVAPEERTGTAARRRPPGPSRRPERIYLHYLLLHLDRLDGPALRYLQRAVDEEVEDRERPVPEAIPTGAPEPTRAPAASPSPPAAAEPEAAPPAETRIMLSPPPAA